LNKAKDPKEDEMALLSKDSGGDGFQQLDPGSYIARCVSVIDLGVQDTPWGGKEKVYISFEVPSERVEWEKDGQKHEGPAFVGSRYTNSINEKAILGQHLTSWRGKPFTDDERQGFDLFNVLGAPCMINIVHTEKNGKTYANIQSIMRLPKGMECPPAESELIGYTPMDEAKAGNFDKLMEWQQKLVRAGYKMAEGSTVIGSATAAAAAAGGPVAPGQPAPVPQTADQAMQAAMANQTPPVDDGFDDDIPF
jgi:hypothetical protein